MADWAHTWCFATTLRRTLTEVIISWNLFQRKIKAEILPTEQPRLRPRSQSRSSLWACFLHHWGFKRKVVLCAGKVFSQSPFCPFYFLLGLICDVSLPRLPKSLSFQGVFHLAVTPTVVVMPQKETPHFSNLALVRVLFGCLTDEELPTADLWDQWQQDSSRTVSLYDVLGLVILCPTGLVLRVTNPTMLFMGMKKKRKKMPKGPDNQQEWWEIPQDVNFTAVSETRSRPSGFNARCNPLCVLLRAIIRPAKQCQETGAARVPQGQSIEETPSALSQRPLGTCHVGTQSGALAHTAL